MSRKLISRSLVIACLATTALIPGAVNAKDADVYFYPKHKWTIERINKDADNSPPICALSNELNNGYVLQIAGTENGFTNLNIDFKQNIFKKSNVYEVQYSLPGHSETIIPTKAFSKNLLVSDLRDESKFADNLTTSSVLDIQIQGNEFRIYLTGINKALEDYSTCANQQQVAAASPIEKIAEATVPQASITPTQDLSTPPKIMETPSIVKTSAVKENISGYNKRPQQDRERYTEKLARQLKEESKKYQPSAAPTMPAPKEVPIEIIEPEAKKATIQEAMPKEKIEKIASGHKMNKITPAAGKEIFASAKPVKHIKKTKTADIIDLTQDNNTANAATSKMAEIDNAAAQFAAIEPAASPSKQGNGMDDFAHVRDKVSQLERQVSLLTEKNKMLDNELRSTLQDAEQERISVSSNNWDLERATMRFNEAERQIMRLGRQLQTQRAQCQIEKQKLETMLFDPELTNTQQLAKLASLEAELDAASSEQYRQKRHYEEKIKILEERLSAQ